MQIENLSPFNLMGQAIESNTLTISKTNVESPLFGLVQIISISKQLYFSSEKKEKTASSERIRRLCRIVYK